MSLRASQGLGRPLGAVPPRWALRSEEAVGHGPWPLHLCFVSAVGDEHVGGSTPGSCTVLPPHSPGEGLKRLTASSWDQVTPGSLFPASPVTLGRAWVTPVELRKACLLQVRAEERGSQGQTQALQLLGGARAPLLSEPEASAWLAGPLARPWSRKDAYHMQRL